METRKMKGSILITGATGLIGGAAARVFAGEGSRIIAPVRDITKAKKMPGGIAGAEFVQWDLTAGAAALDSVGDVDYIIHAASPTSGKFFTEHPLETEEMIASGTRALLDFAVARAAKGFVFLSSMEAYGSPTSDAPLTEDAPFHGDITAPRSSYARGKRRAEALCTDCARRNGLRAMSIRLAQTFGAFVPPTENRVFAQFLKSALSGGIVSLTSAGSSTRMYLETTDAVDAIRAVLEHGESGAIYNAANPDTYCSLADMARLVCENFGGTGVSLGRDEDPANACYPPTHHLRLDCSRLRSLGWQPRVGLLEMFERMKQSWRDGGAA